MSWMWFWSQKKYYQSYVPIFMYVLLTHYPVLKVKHNNEKNRNCKASVQHDLYVIWDTKRSYTDTQQFGFLHNVFCIILGKSIKIGTILQLPAYQRRWSDPCVYECIKFFFASLNYLKITVLARAVVLVSGDGSINW